jgi:hypothetical protein
MLPSHEDAPDRASALRRSDTVLAVLAAVATIAFAWSGFQSAEWVRERFLRSDDAAALSEDAAELSAEADRLEERDTILYAEWRVALDTGDQKTADVIFKLLRPELKSYLSAAPVDDLGVPLESPFDDPEYDVAIKRVEARDLEAESRQNDVFSRHASRRGARYGGLGVLFAAVLATVGIATRFDERGLRRTLIVIASIFVVTGLAFIALSPLSFSAP